MNTPNSTIKLRGAAAAALGAVLALGPWTAAGAFAITAKVAVNGTAARVATAPGIAPAAKPRLGAGLTPGKTMRLNGAGLPSVATLGPVAGESPRVTAQAAAPSAFTESADIGPALHFAASLTPALELPRSSLGGAKPSALTGRSLRRTGEEETTAADGMLRKGLTRMRKAVDALPAGAEIGAGQAWLSGERIRSIITGQIGRSAAETVRARFGMRSTLSQGLKPSSALKHAGQAPAVESSLADAADPLLQAEVDKADEVIARLKAEVGTVVVGQQDMIDSTLAAMIAGEHVLLEGVPGIAKTTLVEAIAGATGAKFQVIQMTPDLLPKGITGGMVLEEDPATGKKAWVLDKGPIFDAQILLADEINRATPKTQSALLQPMQHRKVTIKRETYQLEKPFLVLATQNPIEQEGTNYLPEAQQDRFMYKVLINEPTDAEMLEIVELNRRSAKKRAAAVVSLQELMHAAEVAERIHMDKALMDYIISIRNAVKDPARYGIGDEGLVKTAMTTRAAIFMAKAARITAMMHGRSWVTAADIREIAPKILRHRIILGDAAADELTTDDVIRDVLAKVPESRTEFLKMEQLQARLEADKVTAEQKARKRARARRIAKWALLPAVPAALWLMWPVLVEYMPLLGSVVEIVKGWLAAAPQ